MLAMLDEEFKQIMTCARDIAKLRVHGFVAPEHLLMAFLVEECQANAFLSKLLKTDKLHRDIEKHLMSFEASDDEAMSQMVCDPIRSLRLQRVRRHAEELAASFGTSQNSLHLLWGLLREEQCYAVRSLIRFYLSDGHKDSKLNEPITREQTRHLLRNWSTEIERLLIRAGSNRPALLSLNADKRAEEAQYWRQQVSVAGKKLLSGQVIQKTAVQRVANTLTRSWANVLGDDRPLASFLFVGPRGSGKRSLARSMANFLYGSTEQLHSVSLGDFSEEVRISQLVAPAPEGAEKDDSQEGQLTNIASEYPFSIIYLEDVERANSKTMDKIHQLLKQGHILDSQGKVVDFRGNVVVLSLSIDPMYFEREQPVGLRSNIPDDGSTQESYERLLMPDLERLLRADTLGLVDEVVFFPPLTDAELIERAKVLAQTLNAQVKKQYDIELTIDDSVYAYLMKRLRDLNKETGTLRRLFTREVSQAVAQGLLTNAITAGKKALLFVPDKDSKGGEGQAVQAKTVE